MQKHWSNFEELEENKKRTNFHMHEDFIEIVQKRRRSNRWKSLLLSNIISFIKFIEVDTIVCLCISLNTIFAGLISPIKLHLNLACNYFGSLMISGLCRLPIYKTQAATDRNRKYF